ncbi:MAG: PAS domain-containing protein, partial [Cycloclasticus sp.]
MIEACLSELTFLLIEDDGEFDNTLQVASKALPSQIYTAASAEQAVAILETQSIDILLADLCIAGGDLCQAVRQLYPDITILMVFAVDDIKLLLPLLSLGSIDFLPKPLDSSTLARLVSDITKRVCLQQKLTQSYSLLEVEKEFLAVALRSIGDGVMTTDLNGKVLMLNSMAERLTGWSSEQAAGRPANEVFNIVDTLSGKKLASPIEQVLATGNTLYLDKHTALLAKNGVEYHISDSVAPIFDEQHKVQGTILVFSDISETYRQRQKEKLSNDLMQDLFDNMETLAATLNADGSVIFVNKGALAILDMTLADIQGTKLWDCPWFTHDQELVRRTEEDYKKACKGEPILHDVQVYTVMGLLWVEFSLHAVFAEDGSLQSLVAEGRSVMERRRIEDENYSALQHLKLYREQTPLAAIEWD